MRVMGDSPAVLTPSFIFPWGGRRYYKSCETQLLLWVYIARRKGLQEKTVTLQGKVYLQLDQKHLLANECG